MKKELFVLLLFSMGWNQAILFAQTDGTKYQPKAVQKIPTKAQGFFAGEVKLLNGPFKESQEAEGRVLLSHDVDRLLAPFVIASGGKPKQPIYNGWETSVLPGVGLSFYLSGISRMYMSTGNKEYADRLNYILNELDACQRRNGDGYLLGTTGGKNIFFRIEKEGRFPDFGFWGRGEAEPYYSLEKLMSGLRDAYRVTNNPKALQISIGIGNWLAKHMSHISDATLQDLMWVEYGGMNWVLADLYADTNDKRFLELSNRWQDSITVVQMTQGKDVLNGKHDNTQFPKMSGLAARYPYSGNPNDLTGARFFWDMVVNHRSYATGGSSESEHFGPKDSLHHKLTPFTEENCNEYNMLRLTKLLFEIEPKVEYANYLERTLFNHVLSAQNTDNGQLCYFLPLMPGTQKKYDHADQFSCCTASGQDSYTRHAEYIYSHTASALYVNLFIASEVNFKEKGFSLRQETNFPDGDISKLTVSCANPEKIDLVVRNPYWANNSVSIQLNGKKQKIAASKDGYFHIQRAWNNWDVVEIKLPMIVRTESMPDDKNTVALFYGPILLAADLSAKQADELVKDDIAPALVPGQLSIDKWLLPSGNAPLTFTTTVSKPEQVHVVPLFRKRLGEYSVYWNRLTGEQWEQRLAAKEQKTSYAKKLEASTIDKINACDTVAEAKHKLFGTSETGAGNGGIMMDQKWRRSGTGAMGYEMAVSESSNNVLYMKCIGREPYETWNCNITIDGTPVKTLKLTSNDPSVTVNIWEASYPIPFELTKGKKTVKVSFEPFAGYKIQMPEGPEVEYDMHMPRVIEMRILKH
jgi:DUF1680 family protein